MKRPAALLARAAASAPARTPARTPARALLLVLLGLATDFVGAAPETLRWPELIPGALADVPLQPSAVDHGAFGTLTQLSPWGDLPTSQLLVPELDGREVTISGFVVPLEFGSDDRVREFLLVPYFGACVHVPPPPPNQVIHIRSDEGLALARIYEAWRITGRLRVVVTESAMADAGYAIDASSVELHGS